ncbi:MAG TPA: hypothetical protein VFG60_07455 [Burkholderiaceae bacterium]|nr:hypothetical protein [Burkholderiaceae bacterium]
MVIPDVGTIWFGDYHMKGEWGALDADKGVLVTSDARARGLPAPVQGDGTTIPGDGGRSRPRLDGSFREGARRGDYEVVRQQP